MVINFRGLLICDGLLISVFLRMKTIGSIDRSVLDDRFLGLLNLAYLRVDV